MNILVVPGVGHVIIIVLVIIHIVHQIGVRRIGIVQFIVIPIQVGPIRVGVGIDDAALNADDLLDHNLSLGAMDLRLCSDVAVVLILLCLRLFHHTIRMIPAKGENECTTNPRASHAPDSIFQLQRRTDVVAGGIVDDIGDSFGENAHRCHAGDETILTEKRSIPGVSRPPNIRDHGLVHGLCDVIDEFNHDLTSLILGEDDGLVIHHDLHCLREEIDEQVAKGVEPCHLIIRSVEAQDRQNVLCRLVAHLDGNDLFVGFLHVHNGSPFSCCWCYYHPLPDPNQFPRSGR